MDEEQATAILANYIQPDGSLFALDGSLLWKHGECANLDGAFDVQELEAIAWWMKHKG